MDAAVPGRALGGADVDRKSTRLNSSHLGISYAVFCLKTKKNTDEIPAFTALECLPPVAASPARINDVALRLSHRSRTIIHHLARSYITVLTLTLISH